MMLHGFLFYSFVWAYCEQTNNVEKQDKRIKDVVNLDFPWDIVGNRDVGKRDEYY